ncbi:hypothetical protein [Streptomyces sp. HUAS ZL42]|uniref:hypothetical protein n=1 Tax=Streptomyces sp. HUAS ZL42 TaxID=3231715 RepID=UPI00345E541F
MPEAAGASVDLDDILVLIAHPFGDVWVPLPQWIAHGPGPRSWVHPVKARSISTGEPLPLTVIPLQYRNTYESRQAIRDGRLVNPWPETWRVPALENDRDDRFVFEFFMAPDDASAASVMSEGARDDLETLQGGGYAPERCVIEWESIFTGIPPRQLIKVGEPRRLTEPTGDGRHVIVLSERLFSSLVTAAGTQVDEVARKWARLRLIDGGDIGEDAAIGHLRELADLALRAAERGHRLYCSVTRP